MKRPLVPVALCYSAGIVLAWLAGPSPGPVFAAAFLCGAAAVLWVRQRSLLLPAFLGLAGMANLMCRMAVLSPHDIRAVIGERPVEVAIRGRFSGTPSFRVVERE